ncbi:two-component system sensor histidine kinase NtrB [Desulfosporosinus youngiae]|uniref:histidine kinase n=1 Tax=Desulfosporosinus youngiae DSM 17734 TaxID=768710 RepID=H5XWB0_9FIRM|nr:ATP-binding protein [Desulfosporosinus youngiae]EHQ90279.1 signal transduction histidine kinase, nitrogen specific [Desulfosporosinus youngiae DSM 17734]
MIPLKFRYRPFLRQRVFIVLSLIFIITIIISDILPIPYSLQIALRFLPLIIIIIWFELWFHSWGKVWILSAALFTVGSHADPVLPTGPLLLAHIIFLLGLMYLFDRRESQKSALHQRHLKTMKALLRQDPPLIQTLDYTCEAVILLDNTGSIIELNSQSALLLSLPESNLIGKHIFDVLGILPNLQQTDATEHGEFAWKTPKGVTIQVKYHTRPILDDDIPTGTLVTLSDISEAKTRLEASMQVEKLSIISQVSAGLAHEIRNPLTTIKGFMQLITPEQWPESFRPYQQLILDEIQTIDQLLNNFLLLTSPTAPHIEKLNLVEAIPSLTQKTQSIVHKQNVTLALECPSHSVYVMGDREQLLQALLSILNNAIEVSPKGGTVIIRLTEEEPFVRVSIIDNGPGIPENLRQRVLDPFFTTRAENTGLGLTIAQQIILTHHGKLNFSELASSSGTIVTIDFPSLSNVKGNLSA